MQREAYSRAANRLTALLLGSDEDSGDMDVSLLDEW